MSRISWTGKNNMWSKLKNIILPEVDIVFLDLNTVADLTFDRNYHHWIITQHAQQRIRERNFSFWHINMAFKYGKENKEGLYTTISDIPEEIFTNLDLTKRKKLTITFPFVIILDKNRKTVKTIYAELHRTNNKSKKKRAKIEDEQE